MVEGGSSATAKTDSLYGKSIGTIEKMIDDGKIKIVGAELASGLDAAAKIDNVSDKIQYNKFAAESRGKDAHTPGGGIWSRADSGSFKSVLANPKAISDSEIIARITWLNPSRREFGKNAPFLEKSIKSQTAYLLANIGKERLAGIIQQMDGNLLRKVIDVQNR